MNQGLILGGGFSLLFGAGVGCGAKSWGEDLEGFGLYNKAYYTRIKGLETSGTIF